MGSDRDTPEVLFQLAGAATGIVVFVSVAGGAVTAARLHALGLPIDSTLSVLPREQIIVAGTRVLSGGLLAGLLVIGLLATLGRVRAIGEGASRVRVSLGLAVLALAPLLAYNLLQPVTPRGRLAALGLTLLATAVLALVGRGPTGFGPLRWGLFAVVAVYGGALAFARAYSPPVDLDFADVQFRDGARTSGFLLGLSSDALVLAPAVLGKTIGRTVEIPRDDVINLRLSRIDHPVRPIGPRPVSEFTVDVANRQEHALEQTLLKITLSAQWKYPPLVYRQSVATWRRNFTEFTEDGVMPARTIVQRVPLSDLDEQTPFFAGKLVSVTGDVLVATPWTAHLPQTIVFREPGRRRYLATCDIWTRPGSPLAPKARVTIRGLVIASGIFVSGGRTERDRLAMVCAAP